MLTGYREVPNGDIYTKIYEFSCDRCNCFIDGPWPRYEKGNIHYCGDCAFIIGVIDEEAYKKTFCYFIGIPFRAYVDDGVVKLSSSKKTPLERQIENDRNYPEYIRWRKEVLERDNYACQSCGKSGSSLEVHHIKSFRYYPKLRTKLSNGITLCKECHKLEHRK